jgi:nucleoside-diphosphate-sugar epimerase
MINWKNKSVLVTGGASFIGSHLTEQLVKLGAKVRVAENFSSGERSHPFAIKLPWVSK